MSLTEPYHNQFYNNWSAPIVGLLRDEWAKGTRVNQIIKLIAATFGVQFSRSAIIGKAWRLGLPRHAGAQNRAASEIELAERLARKRENLRRWRASNREKINQQWLDRFGIRKSAPIIEDFAIPTPQRKTLFALGDHECHWPVGDPQSDLFFFCGAVAEKDRSYCSAHCRRAYVETRRY